jgi:pyridoxamine 5'-phosphate oxidase
VAADFGDSVHPDPIVQFKRWYAAAQDAGVTDADNMAVATASATGRPSVRHVLLRGVDDRGFVFFTNFDSAKSRDLAANPRAEAVFLWRELERQVRVHGPVQRASEAEAVAYWITRPRESQISAWASRQSEPIASRDELLAAAAAIEERFQGADVPIPPFWGGFRIVPEEVEFWHGRLNRLHDRVRYRRAENLDGATNAAATAAPWIRERLAP